MSIWFKEYELRDLHPFIKNTMLEHIGGEMVEIGPDYLVARIPVDIRTQQPYGLLHGGASVALAETLGSLASALCTDMDKFSTFGLEINANHVHTIGTGHVYGTARPFHLGRTTQIWEIRIEDENKKLVCISRMTTIILNKS